MVKILIAVVVLVVMVGGFTVLFVGNGGDILAGIRDVFSFGGR